MNKRKRINLLKALELPLDLDAAAVQITLHGRADLLVEQHRGILCLERDAIRFLTAQGVLCIEGETLELEALATTEARISGAITAIRFEDKS